MLTVKGAVFLDSGHSLDDSSEGLGLRGPIHPMEAKDPILREVNSLRREFRSLMTSNQTKMTKPNNSPSMAKSAASSNSEPIDPT